MVAGLGVLALLAVGFLLRSRLTAGAPSQPRFGTNGSPGDIPMPDSLAPAPTFDGRKTR